MPIGPGKYGKYAKSLSLALEDCGAKKGILITIDRENGPSFCCQLDPISMYRIPHLLRQMADEIQNSYERVRQVE